MALVGGTVKKPSTGSSRTLAGSFGGKDEVIRDTTYNKGISYTGPNRAMSAGTPGAQNNALSSLISQILGAQQAGNNPTLDFQNQLALLNAGSDMQSRQAKDQYGYSKERLGIQGEELGMQREQLGRAQSQSPLYQALDQRGFALNEEDLKASETSAWRGAQGQQRGLTSSATARGAMQTEGTRQGFDTIQKGLQSQLEGIGRDRSRLDISKERNKLGYQEEQARLKDSSKNLDLMSKQMGISSRELESNLSNALQQIGLSTSISAGDIARSIQNQLAGQYDPLSGITGQLLSLAFGG